LGLCSAVIAELRSRGDESGFVKAPPIRVGDVYRIGRLSPLAGLLVEIASLPDPHGRLTGFLKAFGCAPIKLRVRDLDRP
jgi:hypothetical protein